MNVGVVYLAFAVGFGLAALAFLDRPGKQSVFWACSTFCIVDTILGLLYLTGVLGNG